MAPTSRSRCAFGLASCSAARLGALIFAVFTIAACSPTTVLDAASETGSLSVSASFASASASVSSAARTTFPAGLSLSGMTYSLVLTNSSSSSPISGGINSTGIFASIDKVPIGDWFATVVASAGGVTIATGSQSITIAAGETSSIAIDLLPPSGGSGTLSVSIDWSSFAFPAYSAPRIIVTPVMPSGTATTVLSSGATPVDYSAGWAPGLYRVEASLSAGAARQWGDSELVFVMDGRVTGLVYAVPASTEKTAPATPTIKVSSGYDRAGAAVYAAMAWVSSGATSYTIERRSGATPAALSAADFEGIAYGLGPAAGGYTDSGLTDRYYEYRLTATNEAGSASVVGSTDTYRTITLQTTVGGTLLINAIATTSEPIRLGAVTNIQIFGAPAFAHWDVAIGSQATIDGASSSTNSSASAVIFGDAAIIAN